MKNRTHKPRAPMLHPPVADTQLPKREARRLTTPMVSFGLHLPNYVLLKFNTSDLWSSSTPIVNELQPHAHMPSRRAFSWEQFNRQKTSRTIDNSHGKFSTYLFAQLFHCNSTSLTCNLPSLQFYTWITNTKNHAPPSSRRKKSIRKKTSKRVTHSCVVSFWLFYVPIYLIQNICHLPTIFPITMNDSPHSQQPSSHAASI